MIRSIKFLSPTNLANKIRLGSQHDGGYIVYQPALFEADVLITYGVGWDMDFEVNFHDLTGKKVLMYDPTMFDGNLEKSDRYIDWKQKLKELRKDNIIFIDEGISAVRKPKYNTFENHLKDNHIVNEKILLKIDIEGDEYDIFSDADFYHHLQNVNQIIVEFHDLNNKLNVLKNIIDRLKNDFEIIHIHGNNNGKIFILSGVNSDIYFPDVVEITLVRRKDICEKDILKTSISYPVVGLDYPNNPAYKDYPLRFDFTNSTKKNIETMKTNNKQTPILIIATAPIKYIALLIDRIKQIKPERLYLVCDRMEEQDKGEDYCRQIQALTADFDWPCRIKALYNKKNLGNEQTMRKAIRWFFRQEAEGIVLDGRLIPSSGALALCSVLLEKYRNDERIGTIAGWNFLNENPIPANNSYFFSKLVNLTGCWGSWRRVWKDFDTQLKTLPAFKKQGVIDRIPTHHPFRLQWLHYNYAKYPLWEQYEYINLINNRLSVVPNIRYDQLIDDTYECCEIKHPIFITNDTPLDLKYQELKYSIPAITKNVPDGYQYIKDRLLSAHNPVTCQMKIPRIIHQIYEDPSGAPSDLLLLASTWKEKHPGWEYRFWNKQMMYDFLESKCPDFLPYYRSYPFKVQRWDAIRYLILYHIGGLYVDLDYECLEPLDMLLNGQSCCMGMEPTVNSRVHNKSLVVGNALMASKPKHPYMAAIIEDMKTCFPVEYGKGDSIQIMETTGPFMVTRVYEQFKRKREITLLPADLVTPLTMKEVWMLRRGLVTAELEEKVEKAFAIHYFFGSWSPQTEKGKIWKK
jgi:mannosyltransferase OCH1-like enzyme